MCVCVSLGREVQEQEISCSSKLKFMDTGPYCHPSLFLLPEKHSGSVMSAAGVDIKQDCNANTQRGSVRGALGGGGGVHYRPQTDGQSPKRWDRC